MPRRHVDGDPRASWAYRVAAWIAFAVMRLQRWRVDVQGAEHLPRHGGAVIVANHTSFWDFFTSGWLPYLSWRRPVRILAKASLFSTPVFGWFMRRAEHIPVHRGAGRSALASAITALKEGELLLVLPEQTISPSLELLPFKPGAARMAAAAGVALVPTVSWGSHRFHTSGRRPRWSWQLPVTVRYGEPLHPRPEDDPEVVTEQLRRRIARLLDEVQRSYPDGTPAGAWWVPARLGGGAPGSDQADAFLRALAQRWQHPTPAAPAVATGPGSVDGTVGEPGQYRPGDGHADAQAEERGAAPADANTGERADEHADERAGEHADEPAEAQTDPYAGERGQGQTDAGERGQGQTDAYAGDHGHAQTEAHAGEHEHDRTDRAAVDQTPREAAS